MKTTRTIDVRLDPSLQDALDAILVRGLCDQTLIAPPHSSLQEMVLAIIDEAHRLRFDLARGEPGANLRTRIEAIGVRCVDLLRVISNREVALDAARGGQAQSGQEQEVADGSPN